MIPHLYTVPVVGRVSDRLITLPEVIEPARAFSWSAFVIYAVSLLVVAISVGIAAYSVRNVV